MTTTLSSINGLAAIASQDCPPQDIATPCLVVYEEVLVHNLRATAMRCGGASRLMPHIKTHRAAWVVARLVQEGVLAFKVATVAEARMALEAGAPRVLWAYPTVNTAHLAAFVALAQQHPQARLGALVDSPQGLQAWQEAAPTGAWPSPLQLHVDLDPGMGRTGAPIDACALDLAHQAQQLGGFGGWHIYDGHIQDPDVAQRQARVNALADTLNSLVEQGRSQGLCTEVIAGASYTFDLWPPALATFVGPGSWAYSSDQHDADLPQLNWKPAAFVLATVISRHGTRATLDAGSKAISPDKPMPQRFRWDSPIAMMNEEHVVVEGPSLAVGDRVLLVPRHACTTAYLYAQALVRTEAGRWEMRAQLGSAR